MDRNGVGVTKRDEAHTDPGRRPGSSRRSGEGRKRRRTAVEETDRLTNMACAIGAGASLVPIPGTSAAVTGMELLLIGAITKVWGHPITDGYLEGIFRYIVARWGAAIGLHAVGDVVGMIPFAGQLMKPAINAGCIKFMGSSLRDLFIREHGKETPAAITAEEAKAILEKAVARMAAYGPDLKDGAADAFRGDGKKLARTLNKIFQDPE